MSVASADLCKAVNTLWNNQSLNNPFTALWNASVVPAEFVVLHDQEAGPEQPFPYCVFEQSPHSLQGGMSGITTGRREIRDVPWSFRIHARQRSGDTRTAKEIAAYLAEEVMKVFGGHPTISPQAMALDNGNFLIAVFENELGVREGDEEYMWRLDYTFRLDVPVAV